MSSTSTNKKKDFTNIKKQSSAERKRFSGNKPLPQPTHVGDFMMMLLMKVCRTCLLVDTSVKIGVYLIGVMFGSIICDLFVVPKTYLADRKNPLNLYFIKMGWAWTFTFVGAYIGLTSFVYCCRDFSRICQHFLRLAVGTFWWYFCTKVFIHVESIMGVCTQLVHDNKATCLEAGKNWLGFDISGHIFIEIHCLLIISEEVKTYKDWKKLGTILEDEDLPNKRNLTEEEILQAQINYKTLTPFIKMLLIFITVIQILFEFMLLTSTVYRFHTLGQKVTASFVAVICWFLSYRVLYRSGNPFPFMPVMPGTSPLNFMKIV
ncbi:acyl-coenzyme A diphosphatase FITM2-like [Physella acuta]|uniref:acyl-coenzyme A diphosphatase FITM2-like n=1 Tax=Physella acuta TaxID=109671 RepID=UPI0027DBB036|nr:acyl-coenzyme A diphosphatase FITM2-like [Physella acuta]